MTEINLKSGECFEVHEDESGKWLYPTWFVIDTETGQVIAGPFDSEDNAFGIIS